MATLQAIADIGYREVEVLRSQVKTLAPLLKRVNLAPISLHFETPLLTGNWTAWQHADMPPIKAGVTFEGCVSLARDHGFRYIVFNNLSPEERLGLGFYRSLSDKLKAAARTAGVNAAEFLREHASRIELVHLKDRAKGTPTHYDMATVPGFTRPSGICN